MKIFRHKLSLILLVATGGAAFVNSAFFFGMLLFLITFFSYSYLVIGMSVGLSEDSIKTIKKFNFVPVMIVKFFSIGVLSYYVLIYLEGDPFWYVGGFGVGLAIFAGGSLSRKAQAPDPGDSDK